LSISVFDRFSAPATTTKPTGLLLDEEHTAGSDVSKSIPIIEEAPSKNFRTEFQDFIVSLFPSVLCTIEVLLSIVPQVESVSRTVMYPGGMDVHTKIEVPSNQIMHH
jgi:hypothetical protein